MSEKIRQMYRNAGLTPPKGKGVHTKSFHRCVIDVKKKGSADNPYAVCMSSLGRNKSVKKSHRRSMQKALSKGG